MNFFEPSNAEKNILDRISHVIQGVHLDIYYLHLFKHKLTIYIINPKTLTASLDECITIDKLVTPLLEDLDIKNIEVSSPGINRELKSIKHIDLHIGKQIILTLKKTIDLFKKKRLTVILKEFKENFLKIELEKEIFKISINDVESMRLA